MLCWTETYECASIDDHPTNYFFRNMVFEIQSDEPHASQINEDWARAKLEKSNKYSDEKKNLWFWQQITFLNRATAPCDSWYFAVSKGCVNESIFNSSFALTWGFWAIFQPRITAVLVPCLLKVPCTMNYLLTIFGKHPKLIMFSFSLKSFPWSKTYGC